MAIEFCSTARCSTQVINDYGPLGKAELLRRFGFVETDANPHACCQLSVASLLEAAETNASDLGGIARTLTNLALWLIGATIYVAMVPACSALCRQAAKPFCCGASSRRSCCLTMAGAPDW